MNWTKMNKFNLKKTISNTRKFISDGGFKMFSVKLNMLSIYEFKIFFRTNCIFFQLLYYKRRKNTLKSFISISD